jgi:hypothetical protein
LAKNEFIIRERTNVKHEMYDYTGNNWSHMSSNKRFKENFGSHTREIFNRFNQRQPYLNFTHNMESIAVNLKPEQWGSLLIQVLGRKGL